MFCYVWSVEEDWTGETNVLLYLLTEHKRVETSPRRMEEGVISEPKIKFGFWSLVSQTLLTFCPNLPLFEQAVPPRTLTIGWGWSWHVALLKQTEQCFESMTQPQCLHSSYEYMTCFWMLNWLKRIKSSVHCIFMKKFSWKISQNPSKLAFPASLTNDRAVSHFQWRAEWKLCRISIICVCRRFRSDSSFWNVWTFAGSNQNYYQDMRITNIFALEHYF